MSKNPKPDYTEWFKRDTLRLKHLVNIAAQADPEGLPPEKGPWANIIEDLDYHIRLGHLEGIPGPQGVKRQTRVALEHLWAFVFGPDYIHHSRWNPIREVCRQWNAVRGLVLPEPKPLPTAQGSPPEQSKYEKSQAKRKRDVETDAELKTRIKNVQAMARRKWPDPQKRPGIKPMAKELVREHGNKLGYKVSAVRQILDGTYSASKHLGIDRL